MRNWSSFMLTRQNILAWKQLFYFLQVMDIKGQFLTHNQFSLWNCHLHFRCPGLVEPSVDRAAPGEVTMCFGRVLQVPISQPAIPIWKVAFEAAFFEDRVLGRHRAVIFYPPCWQDPHRDPHQGHDTLRDNLSMATWLAISQPSNRCVLAQFNQGVPLP